MARSPDSLRAAVYLDSERAHELAGKMLDPLAPHESASFSGVAEGWLAPEEVKSLNDAGLVVELLGAGEAAGGHDASPANEQVLAEDVYNIDIPGPITREQRLQLDKLGVDIAAYEPDSGYRAFLTREQYATVRELPYVAGVTRYSFEQALTPELLEVIKEEDAGEQPQLMGEPREQAEPQVFDCVVHREADLLEIRELIDDSPETEIVGTSNLRVRFRAEVHVPFLAALAGLPQVRKLSSYEAPTL